MSEMHKATDRSRDAKYFTINPRIVKYYSRTPYDYALWDTVKEVAGDSSECFLSTDDLAILSGMSAGKVSECRKYWIDLGFLEGEIRRDAGYPQPVWHLTIPDLWSRNIKWAENHLSIQSRVEFKKSLHEVKASPGEGGGSPGETKNNQEDNQEDNQLDAGAKKPYDRAKGLEEARRRKAAQQARKGDPVDWLLGHADEIAAVEGMRRRVESALNKNLERYWDATTSEWCGYEKELIAREKETGETIEMFMEWFNEDDFRRNNQRIWLKPAKIEELWREAFTPQSDSPEPADKLETL